MHALRCGPSNDLLAHGPITGCRLRARPLAHLSLSILRVAISLICKRAQLTGLLLKISDAYVQDVTDADHAYQSAFINYGKVSHISGQHRCCDLRHTSL